jgi:hypothetical protein
VHGTPLWPPASRTPLPLLQRPCAAAGGAAAVLAPPWLQARVQPSGIGMPVVARGVQAALQHGRPACTACAVRCSLHHCRGHYVQQADKAAG